MEEEMYQNIIIQKYHRRRTNDKDVDLEGHG
jgi:hypothetical protein